MTLSEEILHIGVVENSSGDFKLINGFIENQFPGSVVFHTLTIGELRSTFPSPMPFNVLLLGIPSGSCPDMLIQEIVYIAGNIPVIALTSHFNKNILSQTSVSISDYLVKEGLSGIQLKKSILYSIDRKRLARELIKSEKNYNNLFEANPIPTWVYDTETFKFLSVNEAAVMQYGYSLEEFLQMTIKDIRPEEDVEIVKNAVKQYKDTEKGEGKYKHRKKNGEIIHVEVKSNPIEFSGRSGRLVQAMDISERVSYIQAIEEQNKMLRDIAWTQSHVVRAPLARMLGLIDILAHEAPTGHIEEELIAYILKSARELDVVVREVVEKTYRVEDDTVDS